MKHKTLKLLFGLFSSLALLGCTHDEPCGGKVQKPEQTTRGFFAENFDGIGSGLSSWILYSDAYKANPRIDAMYDAPWIACDMYLYNGNPDNRMAVSTSYFASPAQADRWMISPEFEVQGDDPHLYWEEYAPDPHTPQGYELRLSPSTNVAKEGFVEIIYATPQEQQAESSYTFRAVSLSKYKGQKVRIAFRNHTLDGFLIAIDNIFLAPSKLRSLPNMMDSQTLSHTSSSISWHDVSGGAEGYDLSLVPFGQRPSVVTHHSPTTAYTFDGLSAASRYHCYVKAPQSIHWIGPFPVQTAGSLPISSDLNGNVLSKGWILDNLKTAAFAPIDGTAALFLAGVVGDVAIGDLTTSPVELVADKPITISYDFYADGQDGSVSLWIYSMDKADKGMILDNIELEDAKVGEKQHRSFTVTPIAQTGVYKLQLKLTVYGEKTKDDMRIYIDNISVKSGQ